jgi:hypothetical protein
MAISLKGGWNEITFHEFQNIIVTAYNLPNPLVQDGSVYNTNVEGWTFTDDNRKVYARFVLCIILGIDTSVYIFDDEPCMIGSQIISPPDQTKGCLQFTPTVMPLKSMMDTHLSSGGSVTGMFGSCNNPSYKLQTFMQKGGFLIPIGLLAGVAGLLLFYNTSSSKDSNTAK